MSSWRTRLVDHATLPYPEDVHLILFQAKVLGAFKLARFAYDRLQRQRVPLLWQDQIDLDMLTVQVHGSRHDSCCARSCYEPLLHALSHAMTLKESCTLRV